MKTSSLLKIKKSLVEQKQALLNKANQLIDIDVDGDETDEIQGNLLLSLVKQLNIRDAGKLNQIDNALLRIEEKTYGICEDCDEKIPDARLLANPYFLTCVSCAEEREHEEKRKRM